MDLSLHALHQKNQGYCEYARTGGGQDVSREQLWRDVFLASTGRGFQVSFNFIFFGSQVSGQSIPQPHTSQLEAGVPNVGYAEC